MESKRITVLFFLVLSAPARSAFAAETPLFTVHTQPSPAPATVTSTASTWLMSARGPGEKRLALGVGVAFVGALPKVDVRLTYGLTERVCLEAEVATLGFEQAARAGARIQLHATERMSLAARIAVFEAHRLTSDAPATLLLGAGPGLALSFTAGRVEISSGLDIGVSLLDTGAVGGAGPVVQLRPTIGLEVPIEEHLHFFAETGGVLVVGADLGLSTPFVAAGLAW
ncbi:MAG: hypothetical protein U1E65_07005 [Myxococcota bacterium]